MAQPTTAKFGAFIISLGDTADPPEFSAPCGFTSKALNLSKNLSEVNIPDCDDPDAAFWVARDVQSLSAAVTGEGVLAAESVPTWQAAFDSTDSVPVQIEIEFSTGTLAYTGLMHIESWNIGAEQGGRVSSSVGMQSDGELVGLWTATP